MKKILALLLALVMALALVACGGNNNPTPTPTPDDQQGQEDTPVKIGVVLVGDENEGYTFAHIEGIRKAAEACGLTDDNIVWNYNIPENEECYD